MPKQKLKPRADGRLCKTVTDPKTGKRAFFYGATEREINQKILKHTEKAEKGRTFAEIADEWWEEAEPDLAAQTLKGYKPAYARAVEYFGKEYVKEIEPRHVLAFYKQLSALDYTAKTIANHSIIINQIFNRAVVEGDILYNPCTSVKLPKSKKNTTRPPASLTDEEKILESDNPWLFPLVALLTGLRKGEILALQWQDIDFEKKTISVTKSVEHIGKKPNIKEPKTEAGNRLVPLLTVLADRLAPHVSQPTHYIFSDNGGKSPLYEHRYTRLYKDYQRDVGITCTAHQLRHSYATIAVEEDVNPKDLQNALGHADISTTMNVYAAARKRSTEKVAEKLNAKFTHTPADRT
jgi:integrase